MGVKIRRKKLKSGKESIYLDIHLNGSRSYEFLGLYLTGNRKDDKKALRKAEIIRGRLLEKIQNGTYRIDTESEKEESFYQYFQEIVDDNLERGIRNHRAVLKHIKKYHMGEDLKFDQITRRWSWGFRDYLLDNCKKQNTAHNYFNLFQAALNKAARRDIIPHNPAKKVDNIQKVDTIRDYLTSGELKKLAKTKCADQRIKEAFFFSCHTGLRLSDVKLIQWKEVNPNRISFGQKKTTKVNYVPLNPYAKTLMGDPGKPEEYVFTLPAQRTIWHKVDKWGKAAGLDKHLHYHISRHTFATQLLNNGADIYTVAELLGVDITTAEVYAKIINKTKETAVNNLPAIQI